jgi:hypothetical protein
MAGMTSPYTRGTNLTLHDSNELATLPRALMATTTAGVVTVITIGGDTITIYLPLGICVPVRAKVVKATGAVAAGVVALW